MKNQLQITFGHMASKGLWAYQLSSYNLFEAGCNPLPTNETLIG
jgi:hypothetical protein